MNRNPAILGMVLFVFLAGCGGGSYSPPPPGPQPVSVTLSTMPPASLAVSGTANVAATVANDSASAGVTWSCTPAGACGAFSQAKTASATPTTYTAPSTVPSGGTVTIVATSVTDTTKTASAMVQILGPSAALKGQYAFLIKAPTGNSVTRGATTFAGSVNLDGNGNLVQTATPCMVTTTTSIPCAGMEDIISTIYYDQADPILPTAASKLSNYSVDATGHGTMSMQTNNNETLTFSFVLTSASHGEIIETGGEPGSGTIDLQSAPFTAAQISGTYAFTFDGIDPAKPPTRKLAFGGVFTASAGTFSSGILDINDTGVFTAGQPFGASTGSSISAPDARGRGMLTFVPPTGSTRTFVYYLVSPKVLRLFESDNSDLMGGSAYLQGTSATLSGNFVFEHSGWSSTGYALRTVAGGQFAANGASTITGGVSDANAGGAAPTTPTTAKPVSGTFSITNNTGAISAFADAAGSSTFNIYMVDPTLNILDPNNSGGGGGALLLHTDASIVGTGVVIPQVLPSPAGIATNEALSLTNSIASSPPAEVDLVGVVQTNGSGMFTGGLADYDRNDSVNPTLMAGAAFAGTYTADGTNPGHFTGSFTITTPTVTGAYSFIPPSVTTLSVSFYQASASQALIIQTDNTANVTGHLLQQQLPLP